MQSVQIERSPSQPFTILKSITFLSVPTSAILLILAYLIPWLSWMAWIAFVPFLLALYGLKRVQTYIHTVFFILIYTAFIIYIADIWRTGSKVMMLVYFIAMIVLISETLLFSRRLKQFGWLVLPLIWCILLFLFESCFSGLADQLFTVITIIPVSQTVFEFVAGTFGMYALLLAVLLVNTLTAEAILHFGKTQKIIYLFLLILFISLSSFIGGPVRDLPKSSPESQGMSSKVLQEMTEAIPVSYPQTCNIVVVRHGNIVFEKYYQGSTPYSLHQVFSVTKSFTSTLTGVALHDGYIKNINQKIVEFFPEYNTTELDPRTKQITIQDLLTMKSGHEWQDDNLEFMNTSSKLHQSRNWIKFALELPVLYDHGQIFNYNSIDVHLLSGVIYKTTKLKPLQFADRKLFGPLGINRRTWSTDPEGIHFGGTSLMLRTRDMAKFGELYLNKGIWNGKQIISSDWVEKSVENKSDSAFDQYGYLFWLTNVSGHKAYFAQGYGGQYIFVIPDLDIVTAITSNFNAYNMNNRELITRYIITAVLN